MDTVFQGIGEAEVATVESTKGDKGNDALKAQMKEEFIATLTENPQLKEVLGTLSDSLELVNSFGFGTKGNILRDKATQKVIPTSAIVGYSVKNIGKTPIKYTTEVFTKNAEGLYVGSVVEKTLAPGGVATLTRLYLAMLLSQPEFSFQIANGKLVRGSGANNAKTVKEEIEAYYFSFNRELEKSINDDEVKKNVGVRGADDTWTVRPEYVETFGFLNNPKETTRGVRRGAKAPKYNIQDISANYVNNLLKAEFGK